MRRLILALVMAVLATSAAHAQDWYFEDASIPIAYVDNGTAQFQFACRGGDLAMGYWVRSPSRTVAGASAMNLAIAPDLPEGSGSSVLTGASFAQDMPLIHSGGSSVIVRGPVAQRWARIAQQARHGIRVAYIRKQGSTEIFDPHDFSARGSLAAIRRVLERCG